MINSSHIRQSLKAAIGKGSPKTFNVKEEILPAVFGAVIIAMKNIGIPVNNKVLEGFRHGTKI